MGRPAVLKIDILADGKSANRELTGVGRSAGKMGKLVAAGAAAGVAGLALVAVQAVKSASAVEQATGASEKVFGKYAAGVQSSAGKADMALGLSKSAYLDLANVIGTQLKNAGTPMDKLGGKTDKLIRQGADMAATFGGSTADAVAALSSAMKGELDPIEKYGVSIKKSDVNAVLASKGLDKLKGAALKAAEQQALLSLINDQTAASTGAFADESNTAAGVGARASAVWENLKATLGAGLLPILVTVGTFFLSTIVPALRTAATSISANLGPAFQRISAYMTGTVVPALRQLWSWFQLKILPSLKTAVIPIVNALRDRFTTLKGTLDKNKPAIDKVLNALRVVAEFMAQKVAPVVGKIIGVFLRLQTGALSLVITAIGKLVNGISSAVEWFQRLIDKIGNVADKVRNSGVGKALGAVAGLFGSSGTVSTTIVASRLRPGGVTAAGAPSPFGSLVPAVNVAAPNVSVFIGEREVTDLVRVELRRAERTSARRQTVMGG